MYSRLHDVVTWSSLVLQLLSNKREIFERGGDVTDGIPTCSASPLHWYGYLVLAFIPSAHGSTITKVLITVFVLNTLVSGF